MSLAFSFLPIIVAQPYPEPAGPWLAAGFDDIIPLPIVKPLLSVRIRAWLRLRQETVGRFRALVEESQIGFYRTTPDGHILYANPALVRLLGFSSFAEIVPYNLEELAQEAGYPRARFRELLERNGQVRGFESPWVRRDGKRIWMRENARVVRDEFGRTLYYEGTVEDITEKVEAQEAYFTVVESS
ncbi:MAG: PAS domain-containing protein, partial [Candidatus Bipolaricaulaceae bacterium]